MTRHEQPALRELLPPLDDQPGPAEPLSPAVKGALIETALASVSPPPVLWTRRLFLLGGAAAVVTGAAAYRQLHRGARAPVAPEPRSAPPATAPSPAAPSVAAPEPAAAPPAAAASLETAPAADERAAATRRRPSPPREAADLLHQANERRRQQRFPEALRLYQQLLDAHPRSDEAYVARVAAGSLLLDRLHSPQAALKQFKRALRDRPTGPLSEEARLGLCEVQRALKDVPAEKVALREFLARHGDSPARSRIEARLARLEGSGAR
ncbi:MAG: tetratricopeptide repeat protein [Polyangia bacterium]